MIVANMNLHEAYANLMAEKSKLDWKRDSLLPKALKELQRKREFPGWVMYEYTIPSSNNQYIIYFYVEHPYGRVVADFLCVLFDDNKRYIIKWTDSKTPEIHVLTSHFLQRYRERFLGDPTLSANDTAVRYLTRNYQLRPMTIDERINRDIEKYGEYAGEGFLVRDGFCFKLSGEEQDEKGSTIKISLFTTFMPTADMSRTQREAIFEECLRDIDDLRGRRAG